MCCSQTSSLQLERESVVVSPSIVWRALHRVGLGTRVQRSLVLEMHSAKNTGLLTQRTRRNQACRELNVKHTRTQPRHAWINGFVERLQGTILHEHLRIAFRSRYFLRRHQLQASLSSFVEFYNFERPHQGYRTKGRTPAEIFWGAVREQRHEEV